MSERRTVQVFVTGRVQNVGYRDWAVAAARGLRLTGWVRNRRDGRVEALLVGSAGEVARMIEAFRRGPPAARVDGLQVLDHDDFDVRETQPGFRRLPTS